MHNYLVQLHTYCFSRKSGPALRAVFVCGNINENTEDQHTINIYNISFKFYQIFLVQSLYK